ncbi:MAG: hypothetical protein AB1589_36690 [Cyanobacteriota bacterium]
MNPTQTNATVKVLSPTVHLYHYVLGNSINDRPDKLNDRREVFRKNLQELVAHLTSSTDKSASIVVKLVPVEQDRPYGTVLDLTNVPAEYKKNNDDRLYLNTSIIRSRLAARRLNDTYLLRFTSFVPSVQQEQPLPVFANLGEHIARLPPELGQTVILAAILPTSQYSTRDIPLVAANCLSSYYGTSIDSDKLIINEFLGSPFCIYAKRVILKQFEKYSLESIQLACVFLYKDQGTEQQANKVYRILQDMLLSYHKIQFFHFQSITLKKVIAKQYEALEHLTEEYSQKEWNSQSLKKLPQESLEYYKRLSFLEDQASTVRVNQSNYQECIRQIEEQTGQKVPQFFAEFEQNINFYLEQIKINIGFLSPGIQLFEKLMLSVQTQVSLDEAEYQKKQKELREREEDLQKHQEEQQNKLAQILAGVGAAIGVGQIINPPITATISQWCDKDKTEPSVSSSWLGAGATIALSMVFGIIISVIVYRWFTKPKV